MENVESFRVVGDEVDVMNRMAQISVYNIIFLPDLLNSWRICPHPSTSVHIQASDQVIKKIEVFHLK